MEESILRNHTKFLNELGEIASKAEVRNDFSFLEIGNISLEEIEQFKTKITSYSEEISDFLALKEDIDESYTINFNKENLLKNGIYFFSSTATFEIWLEKIDPFTAKSFFNSSNRIKYIFVFGLRKSFSGSRLVIGPPSLVIPSRISVIKNFIPGDSDIKKNIHVTSDGLFIEPQNFLLEEYESSKWGLKLLNISIQSMAFCLGQEIDSSKKITIRGIKRVEFSVSTELSDFKKAKELYLSLTEAIAWIYEERIQTRLKFLCDRLSLDLNPENSFLLELHKYLPEGLREAKERYTFFITERSEEFSMEIRSLQGQIMERAKIYSEKLRELSSGLLRDLLAIIFLIAVGILGNSDQETLTNLISTNRIKYLFAGLAIYLIISFILQLFFNITDILSSKSELINFSKTTRNYLREDEIKKRISDSLSDRETTFIVSYVILFVIYSIMVYLCLNIEFIVSILGL